ncbi:MAG TPA: enoyl-CoA hydratase/isomerase family protein [Blastocatellia bacterium]|jgi:enoyl-CoA hydratase/carnithine racemase
MEFIRHEKKDNLSIITLSRARSNAINGALLVELAQAVNHAADDESVRGVVLASDQPRFFSGGFDVNEVFAYDRERMRDFFGRFIDVYEKLHRLPKPVVAAVGGHAFAGGAFLVLTADLRIFAEGDFGFALNEINFAVVLPPGMVRMAIDALGLRHARDLLFYGSPISPAEALKIGLAKEAVATEAVLERAIHHARALAEKPAAAFAAVKRSFLEATGHAASDREGLEPFLDHWFSSDCIDGRQKIIESLRK